MSKGLRKGPGDLPIRVLPPTPTVPKGPPGVTLSEILADKSKDSGAVDTIEPAMKQTEQGLVFVGEGLPPLPPKLVLSIEKGEFVPLADLLPKTPSYEDQSVTEVADNVVIVTQLKQVKKKKVIKDIETWVEAFCTFAAIRGKKHPETITDLLAYAALIVKGARDYGGSTWLNYDFQFRRLVAAEGLSSGWGKKDVALWNDIMLKPGASHVQSLDQPQGKHNSSSDSADHRKRRPMGEAPPPKRKTKKKSWRGAVCYPFSFGGKCSREKCDYLHICYDCGEGHLQVKCPKKSSN